jgi:predicted component of type VI protein secretion system
MTADDDLSDRDQRIAALEHDIHLNRASRLSGVPVQFLTGTSEAEVLASTQAAIEWKAAAAQSIPPGPKTSAVLASTVTSADRIEMPSQVSTRDQLSRMSPAERMRAYREGRLVNLGAYPPQPRRIGISGAPTEAQR